MCRAGGGEVLFALERKAFHGDFVGHIDALWESCYKIEKKIVRSSQAFTWGRDVPMVRQRGF